jgi:hypothetical protein
MITVRPLEGRSTVRRTGVPAVVKAPDRRDHLIGINDHTEAKVMPTACCVRTWQARP